MCCALELICAEREREGKRERGGVKEGGVTEREGERGGSEKEREREREGVTKQTKIMLLRFAYPWQKCHVQKSSLFSL